MVFRSQSETITLDYVPSFNDLFPAQQFLLPKGPVHSVDPYIPFVYPPLSPPGTNPNDNSITTMCFSPDAAYLLAVTSVGQLQLIPLSFLFFRETLPPPSEDSSIKGVKKSKYFSSDQSTTYLLPPESTLSEPKHDFSPSFRCIKTINCIVQTPAVPLHIRHSLWWISADKGHFLFLSSTDGIVYMIDLAAQQSLRLTFDAPVIHTFIQTEDSGMVSLMISTQSKGLFRYPIQDPSGHALFYAPHAPILVPEIGINHIVIPSDVGSTTMIGTYFPNNHLFKVFNPDTQQQTIYHLPFNGKFITHVAKCGDFIICAALSLTTGAHSLHIVSATLSGVEYNHSYVSVSLDRFEDEDRQVMDSFQLRPGERVISIVSNQNIFHLIPATTTIKIGQAFQSNSPIPPSTAAPTSAISRSSSPGITSIPILPRVQPRSDQTLQARDTPDPLVLAPSPLPSPSLARPSPHATRQSPSISRHSTSQQVLPPTTLQRPRASTPIGTITQRTPASSPRPDQSRERSSRGFIGLMKQFFIGNDSGDDGDDNGSSESQSEESTETSSEWVTTDWTEDGKREERQRRVRMAESMFFTPAPPLSEEWVEQVKLMVEQSHKPQPTIWICTTDAFYSITFNDPLDTIARTLFSPPSSHLSIQTDTTTLSSNRSISSSPPSQHHNLTQSPTYLHPHSLSRAYRLSVAFSLPFPLILSFFGTVLRVSPGLLPTHTPLSPTTASFLSTSLHLTELKHRFRQTREIDTKHQPLLPIEPTAPNTELATILTAVNEVQSSPFGVGLMDTKFFTFPVPLSFLLDSFLKDNRIETAFQLVMSHSFEAHLASIEKNRRRIETHQTTSRKADMTSLLDSVHLLTQSITLVIFHHHLYPLEMNSLEKYLCQLFSSLLSILSTLFLCSLSTSTVQSLNQHLSNLFSVLAKTNLSSTLFNSLANSAFSNPFIEFIGSLFLKEVSDSSLLSHTVASFFSIFNITQNTSLFESLPLHIQILLVYLSVARPSPSHPLSPEILRKSIQLLTHLTKISQRHLEQILPILLASYSSLFSVLSKAKFAPEHSHSSLSITLPSSSHQNVMSILRPPPNTPLSHLLPSTHRKKAKTSQTTHIHKPRTVKFILATPQAKHSPSSCLSPPASRSLPNTLSSNEFNSNTDSQTNPQEEKENKHSFTISKDSYSSLLLLFFGEACALHSAIDKFQRRSKTGPNHVETQAPLSPSSNGAQSPRNFSLDEDSSSKDDNKVMFIRATRREPHSGEYSKLLRHFKTTILSLMSSTFPFIHRSAQSRPANKLSSHPAVFQAFTRPLDQSAQPQSQPQPHITFFVPLFQLIGIMSQFTNLFFSPTVRAATEAQTTHTTTLCEMGSFLFLYTQNHQLSLNSAKQHFVLQTQTNEFSSQAEYQQNAASSFTDQALSILLSSLLTETVFEQFTLLEQCLVFLSEYPAAFQTFEDGLRTILPLFVLPTLAVVSSSRQKRSIRPFSTSFFSLLIQLTIFLSSPLPTFLTAHPISPFLSPPSTTFSSLIDTCLAVDQTGNRLYDNFNPQHVSQHLKSIKKWVQYSDFDHLVEFLQESRDKEGKVEMWIFEEDESTEIKLVNQSERGEQLQRFSQFLRLAQSIPIPSILHMSKVQPPIDDSTSHRQWNAISEIIRKDNLKPESHGEFLLSAGSDLIQLEQPSSAKRPSEAITFTCRHVFPNDFALVQTLLVVLSPLERTAPLTASLLRNLYSRPGIERHSPCPGCLLDSIT
ncbi:hypothetical protein BLNAU_8871 [Blattamonas nauphoetae]|uniref:Uncharacterized protein n=1 Tax=Blattamonas nauphoetae TaxID=2049346 RepID=A0ABQ9XX94_9EUKA|nr:hypothetical protein BLNAU_8871 [Blattamonas nauphoetae]